MFYRWKHAVFIFMKLNRRCTKRMITRQLERDCNSDVVEKKALQIPETWQIPLPWELQILPLWWVAPAAICYTHLIRKYSSARAHFVQSHPSPKLMHKKKCSLLFLYAKCSGLTSFKRLGTLTEMLREGSSSHQACRRKKSFPRST